MGYPPTSTIEGAGNASSAGAADIEAGSGIESDLESGGESEAERLVNSMNTLGFH